MIFVSEHTLLLMSSLSRKNHSKENVFLFSSSCIVLHPLASQLGSAILEAVEQNTLSVEPVGFQPLPVVKASAVECGGPK